MSSPPPVLRKKMPDRIVKMIDASRAAGLSWRQIAASLSEGGVIANHETLRRQYASHQLYACVPPPELKAERLVEAMKPLIRERRRAGCSWPSLVAELAVCGFVIGELTLRTYMSRGGEEEGELS